MTPQLDKVVIEVHVYFVKVLGLRKVIHGDYIQSKAFAIMKWDLW